MYTLYFLGVPNLLETPIIETGSFIPASAYREAQGGAREVSTQIWLMAWNALLGGIKSVGPTKATEISGIKMRVWFFFWAPGAWQWALILTKWDDRLLWDLLQGWDRPCSTPKSTVRKQIGQDQGTLSAANDPKKKKKKGYRKKSVLDHIIENSRDSFRYGWILVFSIIKSVSLTYFSASTSCVHFGFTVARWLPASSDFFLPAKQCLWK